ncbi:MAG: winged helix-turn-helix domain-containing protein [Methanosarcinales archaeon]|jgi:predicted transcriptional regulator|nr:winged helix-turn-helix domain-containing protein [Methanosarcinales archaeon]
MKDESISDVLFLSGKRRQILLNLMEGPKTIDDIKSYLNSKSSPLMVQIRILTRNFLIQEKNGVFSLTPLGEYTVREMRNILDMFSVFDENPEYWGEAELTAFPAYLLSRIGELGAVKLCFPDKAHIFDRTRPVEKSLKNVESLIEISSIFKQEYVTDYLGIAERGVSVAFVFTQEVIDRLEKEFPESYFKYMKRENVRIFVCPEIKLASCMVTDKIISLSLFTKKGYFFNHDLISYDHSAILWGTDLFHHFRSLSMIHNLQE